MSEKKQLNQEQLEKVSGGDFTQEEMNIMRTAYTYEDFCLMTKGVSQAKIYKTGTFDYYGIGVFDGVTSSLDRRIGVVSYAAHFIVGNASYEAGNTPSGKVFACPVD